MDPDWDPGGPKTCGSGGSVFGSGSATLAKTKEKAKPYQKIILLAASLRRCELPL
jgi:hypothetical protein